MNPQDPGAPKPPPQVSPVAPLANPFQPPPVGSYGGTPENIGYAPPTSSDAIGALVCGLCGWGCPPMGLIALWLGFRARKAIQQSNGQMRGDGLALAGMIIGGITGGIGLLLFLLWLGALFFAFAVTGFK